VTRALVIALCASAALAETPSDFRAWVESHHGAVEIGPAGSVVAVDLAHSWITDADLGRVASMGRVEKLDLSGTRVTDVGLELLAPLEGVRELRLRFAEFVSEGGVAHLRGWTSLETLDLRGTQVRSLVFEHLAGLEQLRRLDLSHTRITDEGFDHLVELRHLESLSIGSCRLDGPALDHLKLLPRLRELDVSGVQRVDSGIWGLALNLENLRRLAEIRQLEKLDLNGATITDVGSDRPGRPDAERASLPGLDALASLENLRWLDLSRLPVTSEDLTFLAELKQLTALRLGQCVAVNDAAVPLLRTLPSVQSLYLAGAGLTGEGLSGLAASRSLKRLTVSGIQASESDIERFSKARPDVQVLWREAPFLHEKRTAQ
jgi:Leucine-rich repeat (LRR) protein